MQPAFLSLTRAEKPLNTKKNDNGPSLVTQPDYRSPLNRDLWIDHLYFQHSENIEIYMQCPLGTLDPSALLLTKFFSRPALWSPINVFGPPPIEKRWYVSKVDLTPSRPKTGCFDFTDAPHPRSLRTAANQGFHKLSISFLREVFLQYSK